VNGIIVLAARALAFEKLHAVSGKAATKTGVFGLVHMKACRLVDQNHVRIFE
jgi:hypothetical protein